MTCSGRKFAPLVSELLCLRSAEIGCEKIVGALAPTLVDFAGSLENPLTVAIKALEQRSFARRRFDRDANQGALIQEERDFDGAIAPPKANAVSRGIIAATEVGETQHCYLPFLSRPCGGAAPAAARCATLARGRSSRWPSPRIIGYRSLS